MSIVRFDSSPCCIHSSLALRIDLMLRFFQYSRFLVLLPCLFLMAAVPAPAQENSNAFSEKELLAVLRSADSPAAEKAITCKRLAIHGTSVAVPDLARLLPDPQLSSWARIALEAIPGPEADEALRNAADTASLEGILLVGVINSIGVRRDAGSALVLSARLKDEDPEVASAAAVALGRIGNDSATKTLRDMLASAPAKVRSAVAEGCVLCAERLHAGGDGAQAVEIYDEVRKADVPKQRMIEATRGAILARNQDGIPLLLEQFRSSDKAFFQLALGTVREFPGSEVDKVLAKEIDQAPPERAALIVQSMADRPETVVVSAVLKAAEEGPKPVRLSALEALGRVGDASCLDALLAIAVDADADLSLAAKESLVDLPGEKIDKQIVAMLPKADGKSYPLVLEIVGQRRIAAVPEVLAAVKHSDKAVRGAALTTLGEIVSLDQLPILVNQAISPTNPEDVAVAGQALKAASVRMPDREACATQLTAALDRAPAEAKTPLLEIIAEVGGTKALKTLAIAAKSDDPELQDAGSRLLGKWNSVDAAPVLLDLAGTAPEEKYQIRAIRGYIGIVRKFAMPEPERVEMCRKALENADRPAEKQLVLDVLKLYPSMASLRLATEMIEEPALKAPATEAALVIAQKVKGNRANVGQLLAKAGLELVKLEVVKAEYGAGSTKRDVTALLKKQAGDLPLIALPASSYNASFGGDPAPGKVKQLTVQYRINGKAGEASFAEDQAIIFPMPK